MLAVPVAAFFETVEFQYNFVFRDNFARRDSQLFLVELLLDVVLVAFHNTSDYLATVIVLHLGVYVFKLFAHVVLLPYYNRSVQTVYIQATLIKVLVSAAMFFYFQEGGSTFAQHADLALLILALAPLGAKSGRQLLTTRLQHLPLLDYNSGGKQYSFEQIDTYIRTLAEFSLHSEQERCS